MKRVLLIGVILATTSAQADNTCKRMLETYPEFQDIKTDERFTLTEIDWNEIHVFTAFKYDSCHNHLTHEVFFFESKEYVMITTNNDYCDGGNSYGAIFTSDAKKTPIAHIYDSDMYCDADWNAAYIPQKKYLKK